MELYIEQNWLEFIPGFMPISHTKKVIEIAIKFEEPIIASILQMHLDKKIESEKPENKPRGHDYIQKIKNRYGKKDKILDDEDLTHEEKMDAWRYYEVSVMPRFLKINPNFFKSDETDKVRRLIEDSIRFEQFEVTQILIDNLKYLECNTVQN